MNPIVADSSVVLSAVLRDEKLQYAVTVITKAARTGILVPIHWRLEVANALLMSARSKRITNGELRSALTEVASLHLVEDGETGANASGATLDLAERHRLTIYDAAYLELALRMGTKLATLDKDLRSAAKKEACFLEV